MDFFFFFMLITLIALSGTNRTFWDDFSFGVVRVGVHSVGVSTPSTFWLNSFVLKKIESLLESQPQAENTVVFKMN